MKSSTSTVSTVDAYIRGLPPDRRAAISAVRSLILKHLPHGYKECVQYGMLAYVVPLETFPSGYLNRKDQPLPYISLAAQKNYMSLYLMCVYGDAESQFRKEYEAAGKRLDMGKCCVRFRTVDDLPFDVIGRAIGRFSAEQWVAYATAAWSKTKTGKKVAARSARTKKV